MRFVRLFGKNNQMLITKIDICYYLSKSNVNQNLRSFQYSSESYSNSSKVLVLRWKVVIVTLYQYFSFLLCFPFFLQLIWLIYEKLSLISTSSGTLHLFQGIPFLNEYQFSKNEMKTFTIKASGIWRSGKNSTFSLSICFGVFFDKSQMTRETRIQLRNSTTSRSL